MDSTVGRNVDILFEQEAAVTEFAKKNDVSRITIWRIRKKPLVTLSAKISSVEAIAKGLDLTMSELYWSEDDIKRIYHSFEGEYPEEDKSLYKYGGYRGISKRMHQHLFLQKIKGRARRLGVLAGTILSSKKVADLFAKKYAGL